MADQDAQVTVHDVARLANVSIKTVSRVINKEPNVRPATKERVEAAMAELGYRLNFAARRLRLIGNQSFLIGLIYDDPQASYIGDLLLGTLEGCDDDDYRLVLERVKSERQGPREGLPDLVTRTDLDGVILTPPLSDDMAIVEALEKASHSIVRIVPFKEPERTPRVYMDDVAAAYEVTKHLIDLGHKTIAHIKGDPNHGTSHARVEGFTRAMRDAGLKVDEDLMPQGDYTYPSGLRCAAQLLSRDKRPTAVFSSNDEMAMAVLISALQRGLRVPEDLSIAGIDDAAMSSTIIPHMTTVRQPLAEMAEMAARMLIAMKKRRAGDDEMLERSVCLPYKMFIRASTAAPSN